jgi:antibiotic biosynthesis monooxygenase (ABM) superfamily enzyme
MIEDDNLEEWITSPSHLRWVNRSPLFEQDGMPGHNFSEQRMLSSHFSEAAQASLCNFGSANLEIFPVA